MYRQFVKKLNDLSAISGELHSYLYSRGESDSDIFFDIKLAVFELAGNILQHSKSPAELRVEVDHDRVYINIFGGNCFDCGCFSKPDLVSDRGRGIFLVQSIAESLKYYQNGKNVLAVISRRKND